MMTAIEPGLKNIRSSSPTVRSTICPHSSNKRCGSYIRACATLPRRVLCADPWRGSYGMEAVARQFGRQGRNAVIRNGWFSYRWTQIFEAIAPDHAPTVLKLTVKTAARKAPFHRYH